MEITDSAKQVLIIMAFLLLVADRSFVLASIRVKAEKTLVKHQADGSFEQRILDKFVKDFQTLAMGILLLSFGLLGMMQIIQKEILANDIGRAGFAVFGFLLSVVGTLLNLLIERVELRKAQVEKV